MKEIKLSKGFVALVDDDDFEYLNQWKWHVFKSGSGFRAVRNKPRGTNGGKQGAIYMHRVVLKVTDPKISVDHKDHNTLNNQKENLRKATHSQNMANRTPHKGSTSIYLGVNFCGQHKKWRCQIYKNGRKIFMGYFVDEKDAALAYNKEAIKLHGEFANLNIVKEKA